MTRSFAGSLLFASVAVNAALLLFFAGVFRKIMNAVDEAVFKNLTELLVQFSSRSPFMIVVLNLPLFGVIPYFYYFGFGNKYIIVGISIWLFAGIIAKLMKLPVYKTISVLSAAEIAQLADARRKINEGNIFQAVIYSIAVIVMAWGIN